MTSAIDSCRRGVAMLAAAAAMFVLSCGGAAPQRDASASATPALAVASPRELIGAHARLVWVRHDGTDPLAQRATQSLWGLDTDDGRGPRLLVSGQDSYAKPTLTSDGHHVIVSRRPTSDVHIVNWEDGTTRRLAEGFALAVWPDPVTGADWIYVARHRREDAYERIERFPLSAPGRAELVWSQTRVGEDTFHVSEDGRQAAGIFPWPDAAIADLPDGALRRLGDGCWTALTTDARRVAWFLDNNHREVTFVDLAAGARWRIDLARALGLGDAEIYHPRGTRDPHLLAFTGPYNLGGWNQVRRGGAQVEVYLARLSDDLRRVSAWTRVTSNDQAEAYPDVWIEGRGRQ